MSKSGRPTKYKKDFHPNDYVVLSKEGKCLAQIAYQWGVSRDTLYEWAKNHPEFSDAIKKGREYAEAWYMNLGQSAMTGQAQINGRIVHNFQLGVYVWLTKNIFKWSDKISTATDGPDLSNRPLKDLTDEELDAL